MANFNEKSEYMSLTDAAEYLGIHKNTLRNYIARGYIQSYSFPDGMNANGFGNKVMLKKSDVMNFFKPRNIPSKKYDTDENRVILYD